MATSQQAALGRGFKHTTVTVHVSETTLAIELTDGDTRVVRRTTDQAVRSITGQRPRTTTPISKTERQAGTDTNPSRTYRVKTH